jgi:hypothetical protein
MLRALGPAAMSPLLLVRLARAGWRFRARGWYRRPPFLPLPPMEYLEWRLHTAYGDTGSAPTREELKRYLRWANQTANVQRGS